MDCQKGKKKKKKSTGTLRCLSHALDPLGFGVWHLMSLVFWYNLFVEMWDKLKEVQLFIYF